MAAKQKQAQIMGLARQTAEQGIGDNDLKRLQRQFDSNKATFVNIDQKQRFMKGRAVFVCLLLPHVPRCGTCSSCSLQRNIQLMQRCVCFLRRAVGPGA